MVMKHVPELYFDGQFIDVLRPNHDDGVQWFQRYFQWEVIRREDWKADPRCTDGIMTQMNYGTWLISYQAPEQLPHHYADRGEVESNVRLCFRVHDLKHMHRTLTDDGVQVTPIYSGPKTVYCDVWATDEKFRITLQEDHTVPPGEVHPSWVRLGVSDLNQAIRWYQQHMGMSLAERDDSEGFAVMSLQLNHSVGNSLWVLERVEDEASIGRADGQVQPYCWIKKREDFFKYHEYLQANGIETSEIGGFMDRGMVSFHFYDPDGNRLNISSM